MLRQSLSILKQLGSTGKSQDATDLLHEDLALVEQRVEPAKKAAQVLHKKLHACLQSPAGLDAEKRMKKLPLMLLSISMAESLKDFDAESSIRRVLEMCCFMEKMLANIVADFEMKVEKEVLEPLNKLSDDYLPEILRNKKLFAKLTTDWQNVRNKCQASTGPQAKQDGLKEEVEEAWRKLENMKDQYSADLYHFASKEDDYANYFICLLELQAEYHKRSHEFLERNITELKENHSPKEPSISLSMCKVYGQPLLSHLSEGNTEIAVPIQECVHMLLRTGMKEEGLFRLAAAASVVKRLKNCLDRGAVDHSEFSMDPHAVAGALKCYLRELPEPLMTFELYEDWFKAAGVKELTDKLEKLKVLLKKLPPENYNNLRYLVQFLSLLSEEQAVNRMTPSNIAIVLGPNLLWPRAEGQEATFDMASASSVQVVMVVEPLIQYSSSVFPEAVSFEIPEPPASPDMTTPVIHPFHSEKEKLTRTASASSTASSCSSYHTALSKTNSTASQDSSGYSLVKSGSVSRGGMTAWETVAPEPAAPTSHSPTSVHESQTPTPSGPESSGPSNAPSPTPAPRSSVSSTAQAKNPTQKQHGEQGQLEPILEAGPNSPGVTVKITTSFKPPTPKKPFNQYKMPGQLNKHVAVHYSKAPVPPGPKVPADARPQPEASSTSSSASSSSSMSTSTAQTSVPRKTNVKRPGVRAPKCPPPLPPPQVPSVAQ